MDEALCIKQEIKEEIQDENEQCENMSEMHHAEFDEGDGFGDEYGNYEYAMAAHERKQECDSGQEPDPEPGSHRTQHSIDFDEDPRQTHTEYEIEAYIDDEPEIFIENLEDQHLKDPLAMNTNVVCSNGSVAKAMPHLTPSPASLTQAPVEPPLVELYRMRPVMPSKVPPIKPVVSTKTYSSAHRLVTTRPSHSCPHCARSFANSHELVTHRNLCFLKCKKCNLICRSVTQLRLHNQHCTKQISKQKKAVASREVTAGKKARKGNSCDICCTQFSSAKELAAHRKQNHFIANAYACHLCERKFDFNYDAVNHLKRDH